jgi:hypothetical protein
MDDHQLVTRGEMTNALRPIEQNVGEIRGDVKTLLAGAAASKAVGVYKRWLVGIIVAVFCAAFGLVAGFAQSAPADHSPAPVTVTVPAPRP